MNEPINHHYLPGFYLRRWAREDGRLSRYHRPYDRTVVSHPTPKFTGFEEYLYTLHGAVDAQIIETNFFSPVDDAAAPILGHLITHGPSGLDNKERSDWTRFIMSLQLRGPHSLSEIKAFLDQQVRINMERTSGVEYLATKQPNDPDSVYDYALQQAPWQMSNAHKELLPRLIDHKFIGQLIVNMKWMVMNLSAARCTLLAGDRPYYTSHGLGNRACLLGVPLSPTHLFVAANDIELIRRLAAQRTKDTVRNANNMFVRLAVQNVYGNTDSHLAFVEKRLRRPGDPPVPGLISRDEPTQPPDRGKCHDEQR
jgi:Protein of unknown function (DUF4238)